MTLDANNKFSFKKLSDQDIPLLVRWFKEPHVKKWWPILEENEVIKHFLQRIRSKDTFGYIIFINDIPLGYIQYYYIDRTEEKAGKWLPELPIATLGTDQFIGEPDYIGKGYGTLAIQAFINHLRMIEPSMTTIIVDPEPTNFAAIRCYEKVGFRKIAPFETPYGLALLMRYDCK